MSTEKQEVFSFKFDIYGTGAVLYLNDVEMYESTSQGRTSSEFMTDKPIVSGLNTLRIKSFPLEKDGYQYRENARVEVIISKRDKSNTTIKNIPVFQLKVNLTNSEEKLFQGSEPELGNKPVVEQHTEKQIIVSRTGNI
ncbi:MAG: hypothetical protein OEZ33_02735 [Gammaproteobacteria bacterium]|nr:hypothetical protein [Gammaproteobacteria bacterium]